MIDDNAVLLQGHNLTRVFGEGETRTIALDGVSVDIPSGQMTLLMGPSGSGKSTLLACLSGLLRPTSGQVRAMGQDIWTMSDAERERFRLKNCGFIFQGYNLFASLTARQQLEMVLRWGEGASQREAARRTDEILSLLGLARRAHLRPGEMSGGEKQRVAIGRALIKNPSFVFADEPTSALDWAHGEQVVELLRCAAHDNDATVLVVSHDPRVTRYADHVYYLEDGRLHESEEVAHVHTNGAHVNHTRSVDPVLPR